MFTENNVNQPLVTMTYMFMSMVRSEPGLNEDVFNQMLATLEADILLMTQRLLI